MYTSIYQNSYVILIITFIFLSVFFYLFEIGYNTEIINGKVVKKFSWKYPLAISLIVWLFWHFYLYPPSDNPNNDRVSLVDNDNISADQAFLEKTNRLAAQKITLANWN